MASCTPMLVKICYWKYWLLYSWIVSNLYVKTAPASVTIFGQNGVNSCSQPLTVGGQLCHFPFTYSGDVYNSCTSRNNNGTLWCSLTKDYNGYWDNCAHCSQDGKIQNTCRERTSDGNAGGSLCAIPFVYNGRLYKGCTGANHDRSWCSTTPIYAGSWGNCIGCFGVSAQASVCYARKSDGNEYQCQFPFEYKGNWYDACTTDKHDRPWCSFTLFYAQQWGDCIDCGNTINLAPQRGSTRPPTTRPTIAPKITTRPTYLPQVISSTLKSTALTTNIAPSTLTPLYVSTIVTLPNAFDVKTTIQPPTRATLPPQTTTTVTTNPTTTAKSTSTTTERTTTTTTQPTSTTTTMTTTTTTQPTSSTTTKTTSTTLSTLSTTSSTASTTSSTTTTTPTPISCREYTSGGTANGAQCFFPFSYKGVTYYSCTREDFQMAGSWCSTSPVYQGYWGKCIGCAEPERAPCNEYTVNVVGGGEEGSQCHFPFTYKDVTYFKCTLVDDDRTWCSLDAFYQGKYGYCNGCTPPTTTETPVTTTAVITNGASECGVRYFSTSQSQPAIVGGQESQPFSWPWQLSLRKYGYHRCGAIILSERWVLTAGHCVERSGDFSSYEVMAGMHTQSLSTETTRQSRKFQNVIVHEDYRTIHVGPDIALIYVSTPFNFSRPAVLPVCMPQRETNDNENCVITGWGSTKDTGSNNVLREAAIPQIPKSICNSNSWWFNLVKDYEICVGKEAGFYGACYGDSGGPLSCLREDGTYHIAGVTSWIPTDCTSPKKASVYTSVYALREWISQNTGL